MSRTGRRVAIGCALTTVLFLLGAVVLVVVLAAAFQDSGGRGSSIGGAITDPAGIPADLRPVITAAVSAADCPEVTPALLAAQLKQESGFDPTATSPVGARGIAQFLPSTWAAVGGGGNVLDATVAIPAAARYDCALAAGLGDIPGDPVENMLAAYNAGIGAVRANAGVPPYPETLDYVRAITAQTAVYAAGLQAGGTVTPAAVAPVIAFMRSQLGRPYVWGATGPAAWDCSSLVQAAYRTVGVQLHRTTFQQVNDGERVAATDLQPGDLLFVAGSDGTAAEPGHVGMYVGDGEVIHAKGARWGVVEDSVRNWTDIVAVVRPLAPTGG